MNRKESLLAMLHEQPNDPFLLYALALECHAQGEISNALSGLQQLRLKHPDYLPLYYTLGTWLDEQGLEEEAVQVLSEGIALAHAQGSDKTRAELQAYLNAL
jgi:tetratricopeptide (TPR) repeat protein